MDDPLAPGAAHISADPMRGRGGLARLFAMRQSMTARLQVFGAQYDFRSRWGVLGAPPHLGSDVMSALYDLDLRTLTFVILAGYAAVALLFVIPLYVYALLHPDSLKGDIPKRLSLFGATFYLSLGVLSQAPVALTSLEPGSAPFTVGVIAIEHFVGILMSACLLGVLINKASVPKTQVVFSDVMLWTSRHGQPHVVFRLANLKGNFLLSPEIRIAYMQAVRTEEGEETVKQSQVEYDAPPSLAPCLNVACPISADSVLAGKTRADIINDRGFVHVTLSATDNRHYQDVHATRMYRVQDMRFNCRFANVMTTNARGEICVDFRGFNGLVENDVMPCSFGLTREETVLVNGPDVAPATGSGDLPDETFVEANGAEMVLESNLENRLLSQSSFSKLRKGAAAADDA